MNRREVLASAMGSLGSLAMMNLGAADEKGQKGGSDRETLAVKTCPVYMCMNNGSYWTYYAMQSTPEGGSPCSNPTMLLGPPNLGLGCPNGTGCVSRVVSLKDGGDDVAFHDNLELDGADGPITFPATLPNGVFLGRVGKYKLRGNDRLKKGSSAKAVDADIIVREIVLWPPQFWPNPSVANQPAKVFYFAQEVDVGTITVEEPTFGSIKKVAKLKTDGHHFRIKLKKTGQGGGDPGDSDFEFDFTLLARRAT